MKYYTLLVIIVATIFSSCEKDKLPRKTFCAQQIDYDHHNDYNTDSICSSDLCTEYFSIWKEIIKNKNNLSDQYFDTHFEIMESNIHTWLDGVSFHVCYKFKIGWAIAYNCDSFIIKINADKEYFPTLNLPRGTYLAKENIKTVVESRAFNSGISKINDEDNLEYSSMNSALSDLVKFANVNQLCLAQITLNEVTGNLVLEAAAQYENMENTCIDGTIDLITGYKKVKDGPCLISIYKF